MNRIFTTFLVLFFSVSSLASAQAWKDRLGTINIFKDAPKVGLQVSHPPRLGLEVDSVAFASGEGECSAEFIDALLADFVSNGVEVADRANLKALMLEHEFSLSGAVSEEDALQLGELIGADALISVKVRRCATEQNMLSSRSGDNVRYTAETTGYFLATVQAVDLSTARVFSARTLEEKVTLQESATGGRPAYPSRFDAIGGVLARATREVHRLFFPWQEYRQLNYHDESQCNLKLAYRILESGDVIGSLEQSQENLEICEQYRDKKPKLVAKALFNLGVSQLLMEQYDEAAETLNYSLRLHPSKVTSGTLAEVRRLKRVAGELASAEASGLMTPGTEPPGKEEPAADSSAPGSANPEEQLVKLKSLYDKGLISDEDYSKKKLQILDDL